MRYLPTLCALVFAFAGRLSAQNNDPITLNGTIPTKSVTTGAATPAIDLRNFFSVPTITGQVVQFTVPGAGTFNVVMNSAAAPNTVANFLAYVNANRFANTLIHRSNPGYRIIQGGGYIPNTAGTTFTSYNTVLKNAALNMEAGDTLTHGRGTIAMARTSASLNTATSEWFINTSDNTSQWAPASALNSLSYAVFGRVAGTGMSVVDTIAGLPVLGGEVTVTGSSTSNAQATIDTVNFPPPSNFGPGWGLLGTYVQNVIGNFLTLGANADANIFSPTTVRYSLFGSPFDELPVFHNLASYGNGTLNLTELIKVTSITAVPVFPSVQGGPGFATFSVVNSNPSLVSATISGSNLYVAAKINTTGSATVTVTATDSNGNALSQTPFTVNVTRRVVDFNSDGNADLVFQNTAGQIYEWNLNGSGGILSSAYLFTGALGQWRLKGIADMNGDGIPDFVFQNSAGQVYVWYLNASGATVSSAYIYTAGLGDWRVMAISDINRDGNNDIVLQNNAGQLFVWYMNGSGGISSGTYLTTGALGVWRLAAIADMNSDGIPDLIFQNNIGQVYVWYLDASGATVSSGYIYASGLGDWRVANTSDLNGDGKPDIVLQNNAGQIFVWYMNGSGGIGSSAYLTTGALGVWRVMH